MIELVIDSRRRDLGGFEVGRVLPFAMHRMVGPFIFFDHMGPVDFAPGFPRTADVRPHPHIGLSTVTYLFEGEITHRDSVGSEIAIRPGEVNWMTAGRGITHSERFETLRRTGGSMHAIQAWVALPDGQEEIDPAFAHHGEGDLPTYQGDGLWARLIAGKGFGAEAKVKTHSPMAYAHWRLDGGARGGIPAEYPERAAFVASGEVEIDGRTLKAGQMAVFAPGETVAVSGVVDSELMIIAGEPIGPRFIDWNFVSSSKQRIEQAKADWRAQRMKLPDLDHDEFTPLPEPRPEPPPTMS
ncbi:pirin family protein [Caulobacter sp. KR2-114]|uniref:pirin family protein n=1 Tax=Caulobacter sp. KR2-114 TaxID=3400912 RepID=UPI003C0803BC